MHSFHFDTLFSHKSTDCTEMKSRGKIVPGCDALSPWNKNNTSHHLECVESTVALLFPHTFFFLYFILKLNLIFLIPGAARRLSPVDLNIDCDCVCNQSGCSRVTVC